MDLAVGTEGALYYVQRGNGQLRRIRYSAQAAQRILVSTAELEITEGDAAVVSVRLAAQPSSSVTVELARQLSDNKIKASASSLTFSPDNWQVDQQVTVSAGEDDDDIDDGGRFRFLIADLPAAYVSVIAVDNDRPAGAPRAIISRPRNADIVGGSMAEFFGDGLGEETTVRAEFHVDGVLRYTDTNSSGHYHIGGEHNRWNTTLLSDGTHTLMMRVFDAQGRSGAHSIKIKVNN